ncbi:hypothetical protein JK361_40255 [Streptomyces sp. 5-8]|uniref:Nephrocystin 3-like N-terminal domain-containing protein n=2 Tax=Streptomyces TaxID=1883 RepID=A0ABS1PEK5_9ACTN|nr:hypothetical protein [Streptomyces musisoli]MBL1110699.1 hypothetical protein [Streptomyces musisoli]
MSKQKLSRWQRGENVPDWRSLRRLLSSVLLPDGGFDRSTERTWYAWHDAAYRYRQDNRGGRRMAAPTEKAPRTTAGGCGVRFDDGELEAHWSPRARGVEQGRAGWCFTGRTFALRQLVAWLDAEAPDGQVHVVTGGPGSGKSAVLARIVTLAHPTTRTLTPLDDAPDGTVPKIGCVSLAILARGRSLTDVLARIAAVTGTELAATLPDRQLDLLVKHLQSQPSPVTVVVDALDEAAEPDAIARALRRVAGDAEQAGVRILVGTRPGHQRTLLRACGHDARVIDLDSEPWLHRDDLVDYVRRRLLSTEDPHLRSPYRNRPELAERVADAVADRAFPTFLIAQLVSRTLTNSDTVFDPDIDDSLRLPGTVADAFDDYLVRLGPDRVRVRDLLMPLAYVHGRGLARDVVWVTLAGTLAPGGYTLADVDWLLASAADFLVEQIVDDGTASYRLYHQALVEALRLSRSEDVAQRQITKALTELAPIVGARRDWDSAPAYVRRYLALHAAAAQQLEPLLKDADFVLAAEHGVLTTALEEWTDHAEPEESRSRAQFFRLVPDQGDDRLRRAAELEQGARHLGLDHLAEQVDRIAPHRPWTTSWAHLGWGDRVDAHGCYHGNVHAIAMVESDGEPTLVLSGCGRLIARRLTDGQFLAELGSGRPYGGVEDFGDDWFAHLAWAYGNGDGAPDPFNPGVLIYTIASGQVGDQTYLVTGAHDGAVRLWHLGPATICSAHEKTRTAAVAAWRTERFYGPFWLKGAGFVGGDHPLVVAAELNGDVHFLDLESGSPAHPTARHPGDWLWAVTCAQVAGRPVVLTAGTFSGDKSTRGCVQMWDPATGMAMGEPMLHDSEVRAVTVTTLRNLTVAVTRTFGDLSIWDLATGRLVRRKSTHLFSTHSNMDVMEIAGRQVLVFGTEPSTLICETDGSATSVSRHRVDLVDLVSLEHLGTIRIDDGVLTVLGVGRHLVVGCMTGAVALRLDDTLVRPWSESN